MAAPPPDSTIWTTAPRCGTSTATKGRWHGASVPRSHGLRYCAPHHERDASSISSGTTSGSYDSVPGGRTRTNL